MFPVNLAAERQADSSGVVQQTSPFEPGDSEALLECRASGATTSPFRDVSTLNWPYFSAPHIRNDRDWCLPLEVLDGWWGLQLSRFSESRFFLNADASMPIQVSRPVCLQSLAIDGVN